MSISETDKQIKEAEEWARRTLEENGALWVHDGEPTAEKPHAQLTSGQHSDGFAAVGPLLKNHPRVRLVFARWLVSALNDQYDGRVDAVFGADTSSTALAGDVASILGVQHIVMQKTEDRRQVWDPKNPKLVEGMVLLQVEELITTAFSAIEARDGLREANPGVEISFVPVLPVIVERSDPRAKVEMVEDSVIAPLLRLDIGNFDPQDCPYCEAGSEAISPKKGNNWELLTA